MTVTPRPNTVRFKDHPIDLTQQRQIRLEGYDVIEADVEAEQLETSGLVGGDELGQEQSPDQARENLRGRMKSGLHDTQRVPSREMPPPRLTRGSLFKPAKIPHYKATYKRDRCLP
jgi:hypothetical protein